CLLPPSCPPDSQHLDPLPFPPRRSSDLRQARISSPDRQLWPGITKWDLARYTAAVGPALLRGLGDRPVTLQRFPGGVGGEEFFRSEEHTSELQSRFEIVCRRLLSKNQAR